MQYLGHIISSDGIQVDPNKTAALSDFPAPTNTKHLKQFGLSNYYRKFVENYASIAEPLYKLLRKNKKGYVWNEQCQYSFDLLKQKLANPPVLTYPDFTVPFIVSTDASSTTIGGIFSQIYDGSEKVIAYWSRQLQKAGCSYSTIEREALAVVSAIKEFYPYLYGFSFTVMTDHNPLTSLKGIKDAGGELHDGSCSYNNSILILSISKAQNMSMQMHFLGNHLFQLPFKLSHMGHHLWITPIS